jgi:hypothetical protein
MLDGGEISAASHHRIEQRERLGGIVEIVVGPTISSSRCSIRPPLSAMNRNARTVQQRSAAYAVWSCDVKAIREAITEAQVNLRSIPTAGEVVRKWFSTTDPAHNADRTRATASARLPEKA